VVVQFLQPLTFEVQRQTSCASDSCSELRSQSGVFECSASHKGAEGQDAGRRVYFTSPRLRTGRAEPPRLDFIGDHVTAYKSGRGSLESDQGVRRGQGSALLLRLPHHAMSDTLNKHLGYVDAATLTVSLCLTYTICVACVRIWIRRGAFGIDDVVVLLATIITLGHTGSSYVALTDGLGKPWANLLEEDRLVNLNAVSPVSS